jgi:hypothetical protein
MWRDQGHECIFGDVRRRGLEQDSRFGLQERENVT